MKKRLLLVALMVMLFVCAFAVTANADSIVASDSNAYGTVSTVDGVPEPTIIDKNAKTVVVVNDKYYTIPTYYLLADNSFFTWSVHANVKTALGLGSDVRGNLVRIQIPEGIETSHVSGDGGKKIESATKLLEASIPTSMRVMGEHFFGKCTALTTVNGLGDSKVEGILRQAFYNTQINSISLPSTVTIIGADAFRNTRLTSIVIPDNVESIGDHAFAACSSLATITVSQTSRLKKLDGTYQFEQTAISSFYFPSCLESIGTEGAFYKCASLETLVNFENTRITAIPIRAFASGPKFPTITFPKGVETIGNNAFNGHKISGDIILPNSVISLGDHAFAGSNVKMGKIVLGAGLTTITGTYTFEKSDFNAIYIPAGVTAFPYGAFKETLGTGVVYYYTGTLDQLNALLTASSANDNGNFKNATIVSLEEFEAIEDTSKKNYIVYGYNVCDAFYNKEHNYNTTYVFESFFAPAYDKSVCSQCLLEETTATYPAIVVIQGFSHQEANGNGISYGYTINMEALAKYEQAKNATTSYGFLVAAAKNYVNGEKIMAESLNKGYKQINFSLKYGETTQYNAEDIIMAGSITVKNNETEETEVIYFQPDENYSGSYSNATYGELKGISYNKLAGIDVE